MTDWRQIQARIRKAKNSPDAITRLNELFERTRDGMVAWELGAIEEKSERASEAVKWYSVAAERFRRAEWKKKAEEALARLGVAVPSSSIVNDHAATDEADEHDQDDDAEENDEAATETSDVSASADLSPIGGPERLEEPEDSQAVTMPHTMAQTPRAPSADRKPVALAPVAKKSAPETASTASTADSQDKRKRRRGRRGGRGRRRKEGAAGSALPTQAFAESVESQGQPAVATSKPDLPAPLPFRQPEPKPTERKPAAVAKDIEQAQSPSRPSTERKSLPVPLPEAVPQLPSQRTAQGRSGDPALASRMAQLESMLRRLLSSPQRRLDDLEQAPAGPGVFLLSDSDQVTSYYVEACQTLRVGLGNVMRAGRNAKNPRGGASRGLSESGIKSKLAEHLGIDESKVAAYMKDHCLVRWIQLDDEATHLAHFAVGVLKTPLNLE
jgi:hypothetical protein